MPATTPARLSIPVSSFPHRTLKARRWTARRVMGALLGIWAAVAVLFAAFMLAIVWDLRP